MPNFQKRSYEEELLDDPSLPISVLEKNLREIDFINKWLGGNQITIRGIRKVLSTISPKQKVVVTDLGCGNGTMLRLLQSRLQYSGAIRYKGLDISEQIIEIANRESSERLSFEEKDAINGDLSNEADFSIALATLFLHHLDEEQLTALLSNLARGKTDVLLVNDLHRNPIAYFSIKWLTAFFSRSKLTRHDACLSVLRGFSRSELDKLLSNHPLVDTYSIKWRWAFRWEILVTFAHA